MRNIKKQRQAKIKVQKQMKKIEELCKHDGALLDYYIDTLDSCNTCSCGRRPLNELAWRDLKMLSELLDMVERREDWRQGVTQ